MEKWEKRGWDTEEKEKNGDRGIREEGRCRGEIRRFLLFLLRRQLLHYRFLSVPQIEERKSRREENKSRKRLVIGRLESQGRKRFGESKSFACWWEEEEVQRTEDKSSLSRHAGCALFMQERSGGSNKSEIPSTSPTNQPTRFLPSPPHYFLPYPSKKEIPPPRTSPFQPISSAFFPQPSRLHKLPTSASPSGSATG